MNKRKPKPKKYIMPRTAGNLTDKVDRVLLHQFLWKYRDRSNFMSFKSGELAEMLGVSIYTMSRILDEMNKKGLLKKIGNKYCVVEPGIVAWNPNGEKQESMF